MTDLFMQQVHQNNHDMFVQQHEEFVQRSMRMQQHNSYQSNSQPTKLDTTEYDQHVAEIKAFNVKFEAMPSIEETRLRNDEWFEAKKKENEEWLNNSANRLADIISLDDVRAFFSK